MALVAEVAAFLRKRQLHQVMLDLQLLTVLNRWLKPMTDGSLVSLQARAGPAACQGRPGGAQSI